MAVIAAGSVIVALVLFGLYNRLVRLRTQVREAWSGIDIQLQRRASLIPNVVETIKGYAAHEKGLFEEVGRARSAVQGARGAAQAASADSRLTEAVGRLFAVAESYPQLRASENFLSLQQELAEVEEKIAFARQFYNRNVLAYNARIQTVPSVLIARSFDFEPAEFFGMMEGAGTEVPVSFAAPGARS